jgi:hypothetical protein
MCLPSSVALSSQRPSDLTKPATIPDFVPSESISQSAYANAAEILHPAILNHTLRVYIYAKAIAGREKSSWAEPERLHLLFTACIYHDMGTVLGAESESRFEIEGADAAAAFLRKNSVAESDIHEVWTAIAIHSTPQIAERISPFSRLVRLGVIVDFKRPAAMPFTSEQDVRDVEEKFPRGLMEKVLGDAVVEQALKVPAKAPPACWPGGDVEGEVGGAGVGGG